MKTKTLTPAQLQKQAEKKAREIKKWEKEKARPKRSCYLIYLVLLISLIYVTDEIASQINTLMKTEIANDLMARFGDKSVGMLDVVGFIAVPFQALSIFYKPLSDRYGRKLFLVVNTFGIGLGLVIISLAQGIVTYILGTVVMMFFVPHDMQVVYIMESAPSNHRAKIFSVIKCVATLGVMLVPLLRKLFMTDAAHWPAVYLIPGLIGLASSFIALFFARETDAFIDSRLRFLRMTEEELEAERQKKTAQDQQGGFVAGLKFALAHKQLRWVFIITALANFGAIITLHYQVILSYGYAQNLLASGQSPTLDAALNAASIGAVTQALFLFPVGSAAAQLLVGFFADLLGRKQSCIIMTAMAITSFSLFAIGAKHAWNPYLVGLFCGASIGSYWGVTDLGAMLSSESAPTNLRSSVISAQFLPIGVGYVVAYGVGLPLITLLGNTAVPLVTLCLAIPGMTASLILLIAKVHDTKGVDLDKVTGLEWD
ncbi:MAG: MFS transporter [Clostridia bacterium]|nr:MFS transporter [Clostridia bacterium]